MLVLVNVDDLDETVDLPDIVTVWTELPPPQTLLTFRLGTVGADAGGVVVAGDDTRGPQAPSRVL